MPKKGQKSLRGQPELWGEIKRRYTIVLTASGANSLNAIAASLGLPSRSELVEQIARGIIPIQVEEVHKLDAIANSLSMSRSEMIDKIAQGIIKLQVDDEQLKSA